MDDATKKAFTILRKMDPDYLPPRADSSAPDSVYDSYTDEKKAKKRVQRKPKYLSKGPRESGSSGAIVEINDFTFMELL